MVYINSKDLFDIGIELSNKMAEHKLGIKNQLVIEVDEESFKKIDEDLYYRNNSNEKEFVPSFSEITVKFPFLDIVIKKN